MKDILKTVLVLSIIALIAGGLLGLINNFTQINEEEALATKIDKTGIYTGSEPLVKLALSEEGISQGYISGELKNVYQGGEQYIIHTSGEGGYGGSVEILVNIENDEIQKIVKYAAEETPGLGSKAFLDSYLSQFYNKDLVTIQSFALTKESIALSDEIIAVSGASKSSGAVINAVNVAVTWYLSHNNSLDDELEAIASTNIYSGSTDLEEIDYNISTFNNGLEDGTLQGVYSGEDCYIVHTSGEGGFGGDVELLTNISEGKITNILVYSSQETADRTPTALAESYFSQFYDIDLETIQEFTIVAHATIDGEIEAVTHSTYSSNAVLNAINVVAMWYIDYAEEVA